ncbi:MAG: hypothetical protein P1U56_18495 [Saprospiraceae bacterium]|nr:hypothetical protein [Saprospiraceae bacterium]
MRNDDSTIHSYVRNNVDGKDHVVYFDTNTFYDIRQEESKDYIKIPQICLFPTEKLIVALENNKKFDLNSIKKSIPILDVDFKNLKRKNRSEKEEILRIFLQDYKDLKEITSDHHKIIIDKIKFVLGKYSFHTPSTCVAEYDYTEGLILLKPSEQVSSKSDYIVKKGGNSIGKVEILLNCTSKKHEYCLDFGTDAIQIYRGQINSEMQGVPIEILPVMKKWYNTDPKIKNFEQIFDFDKGFYKNRIFFEKNNTTSRGNIWDKPSANQEINFCTPRITLEDKSAPTLIPSLKLLYDKNVDTKNLRRYEIERFYQIAIMNMIWVCIDNLNHIQKGQKKYLKLHVLLPNVYSEDKISDVIQDINRNLQKIVAQNNNDLHGFEVRPLSESDAAYIGIKSSKKGVRKDRNFDLLIDCGKGTTDISIFHVKDNKYYSLAKSGFVGAGNLLTIGVLFDILESSIPNNSILNQEIINFMQLNPDKLGSMQLMLAAEIIKRNLDNPSAQLIPELEASVREDSDKIDELTENIFKSLNVKRSKLKPLKKHFKSYADKLSKAMCDSIVEMLADLGLTISNFRSIYLMGRSFKSEILFQSFEKQLKKQIPESRTWYFLKKYYPEIVKHPLPKTTVVRVFDGRMNLSENLNIIHTPVYSKANSVSIDKKFDFKLSDLFDIGIESKNGFKINHRKFSFPKSIGISESDARIKIIGKQFMYTTKEKKYPANLDERKETEMTKEKLTFYELSNFPFTGEVIITPPKTATADDIINQKRSIWQFLGLR